MRRQVAARRQLHAPLDLAHRLQVVVEHHAIAGAEVPPQRAGAAGDAVQQAPRLARDRRALLRRVAFAEQLREHLARVVFHRQRRVRVAERQRGVVVARRAAAGGRLLRGFRGQLERRQRRVLADVLRHHLVERRRHAGASSPVRPHAAQPRGRREAVDAADHRLVLQVAERGDVALVRLERLQDRTQLEVGARPARRPLVHLRAERRVAHDRRRAECRRTPCAASAWRPSAPARWRPESSRRAAAAPA